VLGCGLDQVYPPENRRLADQIMAQGALISDYAPGTPPEAANFPARNRLISGLSLAVVVVEAGQTSGALITAGFAAEQGREVFAVPGPVDSPASGGTLHLLKHGATLVRDAADILEELGEAVSRDAPGPKAADTPRPISLPENQQKVFNSLSQEAIHADDLVQRTGMSVSEIGNALLLLEMQGLVRRLPGNRFERR
jgi:DNA processing protein